MILVQILPQYIDRLILIENSSDDQDMAFITLGVGFVLTLLKYDEV